MTNYQLPKLPYDYRALEPVISEEIMKLHHLKHHQAYVNNLNAAIEQQRQAEERGDLETVIRLQSAISFNGGGHYNHSLFWTSIGPVAQCSGKGPSGKVAAAIERDFGSIDNFFEQLQNQLATIQGSGWGWLGVHKISRSLQIVTTHDHELIKDLIPLFIIDCWEHAYYLQYKNLRGDFVRAVGQILNWKNIEERFKLVI